MNAPVFEAPDLAKLAECLPAFEMEALIAVGGMGAVYKARQRSLDRDVAIKVLPPELGADPEFRDSFIREARAMARLNHPNLIGVYDSGDVNGMPFIVMEYVHGKSLFRSAYQTQIEPRQAVEIVRAVCDGLAHAHENGIIHRDIKPANILLTPRAEPKIGDFGLARPPGPDSPGLIMGTPGYTAPEVVEQPEQADQRSDIFAVGVVLYELLTGGLPGPDAGPPSMLCGCDPVLDGICLTAMAADPAERFPSAREMSRVLEEWLRVPVAKPGAMENLRPSPPPAMPVRRPAKVGFNWILARNLVVIAVLLLLIRWTWQFMQAQKAWAAEDQARRTQTQNGGGAAAPKPAPVANDAVAVPVPVIPEPVGEDPMAALERLRPDLAAGMRNEFPEGTLADDGVWLFPVDEPMGWYEAAAFAEEHGGRLSARPAAQDDAAAERWLGVYRGPGDGWTRLDGRAWEGVAAAVTGDGDFLAARPGGAISAKSDDEPLPYTIEWGSAPEPGLEALLKRTAATLIEPKPVFPPGTIERDGDHYLVLSWPVDAEEARRLAAVAGGHLATLADDGEAEFLFEALRDRPAETGFWIGASREGTQWVWATGERWDGTMWAPGSPLKGGGDAVVVAPGTGWQDVPPSVRADGFLIEWNAARIPGSPVAIALEKARAGQEELEEKAKALIAGLQADLDKVLADNARDMTWALDTWLRTMSTNEGNRWRPEVERLKALVEGNRVPESIGPEHGVTLSGTMQNIHQRCAEKQKTAEAEFLTKARGIHSAFLARVTDLPAGEGLHPAVVKALDAEREAAADFDHWMSRLKGGKLASATGLPLRIVKATYGGGGKWVDVTEKVRGIVARGADFLPSPEVMGEDPSPGRRKELTIEYEWKETPYFRSWHDRTEVKIGDFAPDGDGVNLPE